MFGPKEDEIPKQPEITEKSPVEHKELNEYDKMKLEKKRLQDKIKQIRKDKEEIEKREAKEREMSRRESGKNVSQVIDKVSSEKAKLENKKVKVEKMKDEQYKVQLLDKIKQEKEARRKKMTEIEVKSENKSESVSEVKNAPVKVEQKESIKKVAGTTQIAFKTADGTVVKSEFQVDDTLQNFVNGNQYQLVNVYPRKIFSVEDFKKTIGQNGLANGVILLQSGPSEEPERKMNKNDAPAVPIACPETVLLVFSTVVDSVMGIFSSRTPTNQAPTHSPSTSQTTSYQRVPEEDKDEKPKETQPQARIINKKGNVHGFGDSDDKSKDQKWSNGNNTEYQDDNKK